MKRSISTAFALAATLSVPAFAAGPYDGVYQFGLDQSFHSVHQNGNTLLVVSLATLPAGDDLRYSVGSYQIEARSIGDWDYALGQINGNTARVSGTDLFGACVTTSDVTFENGGATATFVSSVNTPFGTSQGVNCAQLYRQAFEALGSYSLTLRKIF